MMADEGGPSLKKKLFASVKSFNYEECKRILTESGINPNFCNEDKMSPLQHAAHCGKNDLCKLLLKFGADPNYTKHSSKNSALTFAGMAGNLDCVKSLLKYGANPKAVNSIDKTAAQMAESVGNHDAASVISNFIPIEDVEKLTSKLPSLEKLSKEIHKLAIMTNIHPVAIVFYLQNNVDILNKSSKVSILFNFLSEVMLTDKGNELMSVKFHHISFIIGTCHSFLEEHKDKDPKDALNALIRYWIKGDKNGFPIVLEKLLRDDIVKYPYENNTLFQYVLKTLSPVKVGDEPSALSIVLNVIKTQHLDNVTYCATCGASAAQKKCSACKSVSYCDKNCQKLHWFTHKTFCSDLLKECEKKESAAVSNADMPNQDPLMAAASSVSSTLKNKDQG